MIKRDGKALHNNQLLRPGMVQGGVTCRGLDKANNLLMRTRDIVRQMQPDNVFSEKISVMSEGLWLEE
jgi:hypothetical protein